MDGRKLLLFMTALVAAFPAPHHRRSSLLGAAAAAAARYHPSTINDRPLVMREYRSPAYGELFRVGDESGTRDSRYILNDKRARFTKRLVTYRIENVPGCCIGAEGVRNLTKLAFTSWSPYCGLRFEEVAPDADADADADIVIEFVAGEHGDGRPFDGAGGETAHATLPTGVTSFIHFDDDEIWLDENDPQNPAGIDFFYIVLHEIGHCIGLEHAPWRHGPPVMVGLYDHFRGRKVELRCDDILGANRLYGVDNYPSDCRNEKFIDSIIN